MPEFKDPNIPPANQMEQGEVDEVSPKELGLEFNAMSNRDFVSLLRNKIEGDSSVRISIIADWINVQKARSAKALLDQHASKLNIDSITIRATRKQYEEDVNAFESGVQWEEI
jgi:hypothetical protein